MKTKCKICGKEFNIYPSKIKQGRGKYCSRECYDKAVRHNTQEIMVKRICQSCGKEFYVYPSVIRKGERNGLFCSKDCMYKSRRQQYPTPQNIFKECLDEYKNLMGYFCKKYYISTNDYQDCFQEQCVQINKAIYSLIIGMNKKVTTYSDLRHHTPSRYFHIVLEGACKKWYKKEIEYNKHKIFFYDYQHKSKDYKYYDEV